MKNVIGGKRYDTEKTRIIAKKDRRSHSNNYAGTIRLGVASDGALLQWGTSNGQDCYISDFGPEKVSIQAAREWLESSGADMDEEGEKIAVDIGLIEIVA